MDTHVTTSPVFDNSPTLRARLPGEPDEGVSAEEAHPALHADRREAPPPARKNRRRLLAGVAIVALVAIAGGGFLASPYNTVVPVPPALKLTAGHVEMRIASLFGHPAEPPARESAAPTARVAEAANSHASPAPAASDTPPGVVAPSAALAPIHAAPPPASVVLPPYKPSPQNTEMAELLDLQHGGSLPAASASPSSPPQAAPALPKDQRPSTTPSPTAAGQSAKSATAAAERPASVQAGPAQIDAPPPGYVAREPGMGPVAGSASQDAQAHAGPAEVGHVGSGAALESAQASSPKASAVSPTTGTQPASSRVHAQPMHQIVVGPNDVLAISPKLEAAPMAPAQQIQVLEMVTQLATLIRDQRTEIANLQADVVTNQKATAAKLGELVRAGKLVEAGSALTAASNAPAPAAAGTPVSGTSSPTATTVALTSAKAALAAASAPQATPPGKATAAPAAASSGTPEQYRVQAASPGLAMLAEVDHSGGDGAQQEVQVGDVLPGYGRVLSVAQQGTAWVVKTEHGTIQ